MMGPRKYDEQPELNGDREETCSMHPALTTVLSSMQTDIKWLLRLGWTAVAACGGTIVLVVSIIQPYAASINRDLLALQSQMAVNTATLSNLRDSDRRSEEDRKEIHRTLEILQQQQHGK